MADVLPGVPWMLAFFQSLRGVSVEQMRDHVYMHVGLNWSTKE